MELGLSRMPGAHWWAGSIHGLSSLIDRSVALRPKPSGDWLVIPKL
jgi:hypothetical protein